MTKSSMSNLYIIVTINNWLNIRKRVIAFTIFNIKNYNSKSTHCPWKRNSKSSLIKINTKTKLQRISRANNKSYRNKVWPLRMTNLHMSIPFTSASELFPTYIHFIPSGICRNFTKALLTFATWFVAPV